MELQKIFVKVRDLPYHCPEFYGDYDYRCWGKNRLLYDLLIKNNFNVHYLVCSFLWSK